MLTVRKLPAIADLVRFDEDLKSHVILSEEMGITREDFESIGEYLQKKDFGPRIVESDTHQRLEGVVLPEEKDEAAVKIAKTYRTASKIQFGDLQGLCVLKLKALYPLSPQYLLIVALIITRAERWGCDAEDEILEWLVSHVAERFWRLVEYEHLNLKKVMLENEMLRQGVFRRLTGDPGAWSRTRWAHCFHADHDRTRERFRLDRFTNNRD